MSSPIKFYSFRLMCTWCCRCCCIGAAAADDLEAFIAEMNPRWTPAERAFYLARKAREAERIKKQLELTHRQRMEKFNKHLASLSERELTCEISALLQYVSMLSKQRNTIYCSGSLVICIHASLLWLRTRASCICCLVTSSCRSSFK